EAALARRLASGQERLQEMEGVNLAAPEEYDALMERLKFLRRESADLDSAIADLEESIRRMNSESRRRFKETFDQVNEKFQEVFPLIFNGGEARLVMTDSEDPLLAGVDVVARPPGKKLQGLTLLSGGEKALTAIALIFSFFLIKPSPFCLLDEVDAPLDDANISRFSQLVRNMTDKSQFIIITHNKRTMEVGDLLYGVTMEEPGVSKIVSVNLSG
ncbi:MAG: AAA family ATPase, partial [SAR324 cluster bacterium]|nr:AAA family ATPase [SAR324 cluster bacterium]